MKELIYSTIIGLLTGVLGTLGGGLIIILIRRIKESLLSIVLGVSAGIMTVVVFFDLIPEAERAGSIWTGLLGILLGIGLIAVLDLTFPHQHFSAYENYHGQHLKTGLLLAIGIALHNIPEGLAIGAGYSASSSLGLGLAIIMAVQNLPEGMAIGTTLGLAGLRGKKIILITFMAGVPMGVGAFLGAYLGSLSQLFLSLSLGFAAGAMLYIIFDELIPSAHDKAEGHSAIMGILGGIILGIILTKIL